MAETLPDKPKDAIYELLARNKMAIQNVLPKHLTAERILRLAYTAIQRSPKLRQCTPASLTNSVLELSMLGLEMGRTGHIVPFGKEAVFIPDYKGYIDLAHRSDRIESFPFKPVYANDEFDYEEGTTRYIKHVPCKRGDRGALVAAYAVCFFKHGGFDFEVVWQPDIDATKKTSPGARHADSPWNKPDQEWTMWCKTAVRRLAKRIPQSPELQKAAYHEEMAEAGLKQDIHYIDDPIDIEGKTEDLDEKLKNGKKGAAKELYGEKPEDQKTDEEDTGQEFFELSGTKLSDFLGFRGPKSKSMADCIEKNREAIPTWPEGPRNIAMHKICKHPEWVKLLEPEKAPEEEAPEEKTEAPKNGYANCPPDSGEKYAGKQISYAAVCSVCKQKDTCDVYQTYLDLQRGGAEGEALE